MTPTFLDPLLSKHGNRFELVHVESGAVLASRVEFLLERKARRRGLRGRGSLQEDLAVVIAPSRVLRPFFARFPVDAIFVARDGTVLKTCRAVGPWRVTGALESYATIVSAPGFIDHSGTTPGDRVALREAQAPRPAREILPQPSAPGGWSLTEPDVDPWGLGETVPGHAGSREVSGPVSGLVPLATAGSEAAAAAGERDRSPDAVDLDRILSRGTPVAWFEAVAVVMALCEEVVALGPENDLRIPDLPEIAITPEGGVELLREGPPSPAPAGRAARLLLTLLNEAQSLPVRLRLLALEEVSPTPTVGSLREFSNRLGFFERPGRRAILRGLYDRFQQMPAPRTEVRAEPPRPLAPPRLPRWWRRRPAQAGIGAAALIVLLLVTTLWLYPRAEGPGMAERRGPVARTVATAAQKAAQVAGDSLLVLAQWLGLAATDRPTASPAPTGAPADAGVDSPTSRRPRRAPRPAVKPVIPDAESPVAPTLKSDTIIYAEGDPRVVPPKYLRSRLPSNVPSGVSRGQIPEIEAVISAEGEVESVRLITQPTSVLAAMMLSAVKNWRFEPAMKDGRPVRYRMRVRLTNQ